MLPLNHKECILVETHLHLIPKIIHYNITVQGSIQGLEYDDLYQTACEALCHAAQTYNPEKGASFATFAKVVIHNHLISHCRQVVKIQKPLDYLDAPLDNDESLTLADTLSTKDQNPFSDLETCIIFDEALNRYHGIYRKGLYAIKLRNQGHSNTEIASYFDTKPNHIAAWITKAAKKARTDCIFSSLS